jgi:hypothetical protein
MAKSLVFPKKVRQEWFEQIRYDIDEAIEARRNWFSDYVENHRTVRMVPPSPFKDDPWEGASNLVHPIGAMQSEQSIRRLTMYLMQGREYIDVLPASSLAGLSDRAQTAQDILRYQAESHLDYWNVGDNWTREYVVGGTSIFRTGWAYRETQVVDVFITGRDRLVADPTAEEGVAYRTTGEPVSRGSKIDGVLKETIEANGWTVVSKPRKRASSSDQVENWDVVFKDERGRKRTAVITIDYDPELGDQCEVIARMPRVVKNSPLLEALTADRIIVPPGDHSIQTAEHVNIKSWCNHAYVNHMLETRKWNLDDDEREKLMGRMSKPDLSGPYTRRMSDRGEWHDEPDAQEDQDDYVGVDTEPTRAKLLPIIEVFRDWPIIKGSKECVPARLVILPQQGTVARVHFEGADGLRSRRCMSAHHFIKARNEFYGIGLPRFQQTIQDASDITLNMEMDGLALATLPWIALDHSAVLPRDNRTYRPGAVVRASDPASAIFVPQIPSHLVEFESIGNRLMAFATMTGHQSEASAGLDVARPNANRTARGAAILLSEKNFNVSYDGEALCTTVAEMFSQIHEWNVTHLPEGFEFRAFGTETIKQLVVRDEIRGEFDFRFQAGQATMNDELRLGRMREYAQIIAPLAQASAEQVPLPVYRLVLALGKLYGFKQAAEWLPEPINDPGPALTPAQEHQLFAWGRQVHVHPKDNDLFHFEKHREFMMSEQFGLLPTSAMKLFQEHLFEHMRRIQSAMTRGQNMPGETGQVLGGAFGLGAASNPMVNATPGQPAGAHNISGLLGRG